MGGRKMSTAIKIVVGNLTLRGELTDTACAKQIIAKLPIDARPDEWGDEFYFSVPVKAPLDETATTKVYLFFWLSFLIFISFGIFLFNFNIFYYIMK